MVRGKGYLEGLFNQFSKKNPFVESYRTADDRSSWGATLVELKK